MEFARGARRRWTWGSLVAAMAIIGVVLVVVHRTDGTSDVERRREIYGQFPEFPGATKVSEDKYEIRGDGVGTGEYGLKVVYRLPADVTSTEVFDFLRAGAPADWTIANDQTCVDTAAAARAPPPPYTGANAPPQSTIPPPSAWVLILGRSRLTFLPRSPSNVRDGVTFSLSREGASKFVTLDGASYSCAPVPTADDQADRFDQP